jgi:hypothetical protein
MVSVFYVIVDFFQAFSFGPYMDVGSKIYGRGASKFGGGGFYCGFHNKLLTFPTSVVVE